MVGRVQQRKFFFKQKPGSQGLRWAKGNVPQEACGLQRLGGNQQKAGPVRHCSAITGLIPLVKWVILSILPGQNDPHISMPLGKATELTGFSSVA